MKKEKYVITGRIILLLTSFLVFLPSFCQDFEEDVKFIHHLFNLEAYDEALLALDLYDSEYSRGSRRDTINYFRGKAHYYQKNIHSSIKYFDQVSQGNPFWQESQFLSLYQKSYHFQLEIAKSGWKELDLKDNKFTSVRNFELAGISLLERDIKGYEYYSSNVDPQYYLLKSPQENLRKFATGIREFKSKSPLLAGIFSAIIPGTGKMYIGKVGEGVISLLTVGIFGLQTWEGYRKDGVKSVRFILFGTALTTFYIGNIWGSVLAVKIRNDEFNEQINQSVLFTMHVPLRLLFD